MDKLQKSNNNISIGEYKVRRIGLGTNRLTDTPGNRELLNYAITLGLNFIDTANIYTGGASEETIGNTLSPYNEGLVIATKGGMVRGAPANTTPEHLRKVLDESLNRLKTGCITLYQLHRVNPEIPIEETMKFLKQLQREGKIKHIGLSEVTVEQLERALSITEVVSVQNNYSLGMRKHDSVVDFCEEHR